MGKKSKSKHHQSRSNKQKNNNNNTSNKTTTNTIITVDNTNNNNNDNNTNNNKLSLVLQKLRHADPQICHGALSALLHIQFDPTTLLLSTTSNNNKKVVLLPIPLLQAIREQVVNRNIHCAITAATCLSNYLAYSNNNNNNESSTTTSTAATSSNNNNDTTIVTAGWMIVFIGRLLSDCIPKLNELLLLVTNTATNTNTNNTNKQATKEIEDTTLLWLELTEKCLLGVVHLIERNPYCMDRLVRSTTLRDDCFTVLQQIQNFGLQYSAYHYQQQYNNTKTEQDDVNSMIVDAVEEMNNNNNKNSGIKERNTKQQQQQQSERNNTLSSQRTEQKIQYIQSIITLACRCCHSILDDDSTTTTDLIVPYMIQNTQRFIELLSTWRSIIILLPTITTTNVAATATPATTGSSIITTRAQLHTIGAWINLWMITKDSSSTTTTKIPSDIVQYVNKLMNPVTNNNDITTNPPIITIGSILGGILRNNGWNNIEQSEWIQQLCTKYDAYQQQDDDATLEQQVIKDVQNTNESARSIARRQQAEKKKQQQQQQNEKQKKNSDTNNTDGIDMEEEAPDEDQDDEEEEEETKVERSGKLKVDRTDHADAWEVAYQDWFNTTIVPLQLTLEIIANLSATTNSTTVISGSDDYNMDDNDEEDYMVTDVVGNDANTVDGNVLDESIVSILVQNHIPGAVYKLVVQVLSSDVWHVTATSSSSLPEQIQKAGSDLQCKAAVCLGHCFTNLPPPNLSSSSSDNNNPEILSDEGMLWSNFIQPTFHSLSNDEKASFLYLSDDVQQVVCTTAVAAIRSRLNLQHYILEGSNEIDHLLAVLPTSTTTMMSSSNLSVTRSLIIRDIINILGIVVSQQDHSIDIDRKVCYSMMNVLSYMGDEVRKISSTPNKTGVSYRYVVIVAEIVNAIMDIYGKDDCYITVFTSCDCLSHIQQAIPLLKKHIGILRAAVTNQDYDYTYDDIDQWKEIMVNANRFVQYIKQEIAKK